MVDFWAFILPAPWCCLEVLTYRDIERERARQHQSSTRLMNNSQFPLQTTEKRPAWDLPFHPWLQVKPEKEQNESQLFPCIRKWTEAEMGSRPNCSFKREQLFTYIAAVTPWRPSFRRLLVWLVYMLACDGLQKITLRRVIFWRRVTWMLSYWLRRFYGRKTIRTLGTLTRNLPFQANPNKERRTWLVTINLGGCSQKSP